MMTIVKVSSDIKLKRRCLDYGECRGLSRSLRHHGTCALVGSSGILLNSSCGDDIDASDFVIRFNLSPQEGYTTDVGKKSSMMVLNTIMSLRIYEFLQGAGEGKLKEKDIQKANNTILFFPKSTTHHLQRGKSFEQMLRRQGLNVVVVMGVTAFHNDEMRRQAWDVLDKHHNSDDRPSTGLLLVEVAITFCDRIQVYGFYPFARDQQNRTVPYHYWDDVTSVNSVLKRKHTHNFAAEFEILRTLHNNGVIEHRIGHC
ncbi:PREDICTED: alpha-2,8-sialyltransferase 8B-like [Branchiostoma belcheri]|uniref:Alpha-2,8-sialyltransferase 8B-like n=1 Tax=Branchiostoma belcheri TaxID=7741 RepID=A0A6P5A1L9_BRABE|nr:PREDICTED: alpha-2,8-sialyltransferase 8B-like [Branchiostoma belcheri]